MHELQRYKRKKRGRWSRKSQTIEGRSGLSSRSGGSAGRDLVGGCHLRAGSDVRWRGSRRCGVLGGGVCVGVALLASVVLPVAGSAPSQDQVRVRMSVGCLAAR